MQSIFTAKKKRSIKSRLTLRFSKNNLLSMPL